MNDLTRFPRSGAILRLLDANANRAREALRVLEDYARFVIDDDALSSDLKQLRHELTAAQPWLADAIIHRDTPGDVGTTHGTHGERVREDLSDVVTAAGKRLGEALRAVEEYAKTISPPHAAIVESLRYRTYDLEQRIGRTLRRAGAFRAVRLYVLITESACHADWQTTLHAALAGGADAIQLREKSLDSGELLRRARIVVAACRKAAAISIINDRPDIAVLSDADGVHVGQDDLPATEVRKLVGREKIVGVSTHKLEQAERALLDGADYIGAGPVFRSSTKPRVWETIPGLNYLKQLGGFKLPVVAIAGITSQNVGEVTASCVAVTAAVTGAEDVTAACRELKSKVRTPHSHATEPGVPASAASDRR